MVAPRVGSAASGLVVPGLLLAFVLQAFASLDLKSPTFDEPAHIGAGLSYLRTGDFKVNLQHPPLLKEIGALPLILMGVRLPMSDDDWSAIDTRRDPGFQWRLGNAVIYGNDADRVMFWSRLPFLALATLLGLSIYLWGRRLLGDAAALGALALYVFDPTIIAHATLVATDVGFAAFALLFVFSLWHYLNRRSYRRLALCGLALGAALAAKFTGVVLLPLAALLLAGGTRWIPADRPLRSSSIADPYASAGAWTRLVWCLYALIVMAVLAAIVVHALYFFSGNPFLYLEGLRLINADHDSTYQVFMAGGFSRHFWSYYLVAYLLKEPVPILILVTLGLVALLRRGGAAAMDRAFLLLPPAILFVIYSVTSHNLGFRYMIPALPFLYLVGGAGLVRLWRQGPLRRAAAGILYVWLALSALGVYPDHLSYFNESACLTKNPARLGLDGGTSCGPLWLDDSNVDWGQGLKQLKIWLDREAPGETIRLGYFGSISPERYGLRFERVRGRDLDRPPAPGLYALSAHLVARAGGTLTARFGDGPENWLRHTRPTTIVGHAYHIYDLRPGVGR